MTFGAFIILYFTAYAACVDQSNTCLFVSFDECGLEFQLEAVSKLSAWHVPQKYKHTFVLHGGGLVLAHSSARLFHDCLRDLAQPSWG